MPRSSDVGTPVLLLDPPATPQDPRHPLKVDENYQFMLSDAEVDRQAREHPHGHLTPLPGGVRAKCSGPRRCGVCRREAEILAWEQTSPEEKMSRQMERLRSTAEYRAVVAHYDIGDTADVASLDRLERGVVALLERQAPVESILAYYLHPLVQDDALARFDPTLASTATVLMYVMEYRNLTDRASLHDGQHDAGTAVSPLTAVNQMLAATRAAT